MKSFKFISVILVLSMLPALFTPALASDTSPGSDVPSSWAAEKVALAIEAGIVPPNLQGDYQKDITRYEYAQLMIQLLEVHTGLTIEDAAEKLNLFRSTNAFKDIQDSIAGYSYCLEIFYYQNYDYSNTNFNPDKPVSRQDMAYALYSISKFMAKHFFDAVPPFTDEYKADSFAKQAIKYVKARGIVAGTGNNIFNPNSNVTIEQAIMTAYSLFAADEKPFNEIGCTSLLFSNDDVYIENEYFILHIGKGLIYSSNLEQQIILGFIEAEKITGLKTNPDKYKNKIILEAVGSLSYGSSDSYYKLNNEDLIINNISNYVKFANIAAVLLYRRNALKNSHITYDSAMAYGNVIQFIANQKNNICSWRPYYNYSDKYITPEDLSIFVDQRFEDVFHSSYPPEKTYPPVVLSYLFYMFIYDKYGVEKLNKFLLSAEYIDITDKEAKYKYTTDNLGINVKGDFKKWYAVNDGKYTAAPSYLYTTDGFIHEAPPISITGIYNHMPVIRQNSAYFNPLCFFASKKAVTIDLREAYKYASYKGENLGLYRYYIKCNSTTTIKTYDVNGKIIGTNTYGASYGSHYEMRRGAYYEIIGDGLCEIVIYDSMY